MTKERLSRLYYIRKEIKMWENKFRELDLKAQGEAVKVTGMPFTPGGTSDKTGVIATQKADITAKIEAKKIELEAEQSTLMEYIIAIDNTYMRQIMYLRHVECRTWNQVARSIGYAPAEGVRKAHDRFLRREVADE